jgi:predicted nucleic-acid-binding Zn-ribbon protein
MDRPFEEVALLAKTFFDLGHTVFQNFTCRHCGLRQTMEEPNRFFTAGTCEECGGETDLLKAGCGYLLLLS